MSGEIKTVTNLLEHIVEKISIPQSMYEKAAERHRSLGEWLCRDNSTLKDYKPDIRPQGSFRYGIVNRPLDESKEYDLDNVCVLRNLSKSDMTQKELKLAYGLEIQAYAEAHGMLNPIDECKRCWRLKYADEVQFHLDTLPCVPEDSEVIDLLIQSGVEASLAKRCVAITDNTHESYDSHSESWYNSNPRGFARWFESRCLLAAKKLNESKGIRADVESVPPYGRKTPLQKSIQILKRHRDVMFQNAIDQAPISMIITNLAAQAYDGETDLFEALSNIISKMPLYVLPSKPRVPNPADPEEDYADKWLKNPKLEESFWNWVYAVKHDLINLKEKLFEDEICSLVKNGFAVVLPEDAVAPKELSTSDVGVSIVTPSRMLHTPKPWGKL